MATSGTATFNLDINEIIEEAYERAGLGRAFSGNDYRTARRSLNLLAQDFANRGINLWTVEDATLSLINGTATYVLPADTVSVLDHSIRTGTGTSQSDLAMTRMSLGEFAGIANKNTTGRPVKIYVERLRDAPQITVWPVPNNSTYTLVYYRIRRIHDAVSGSESQYDAPARFLPAIVSGLSYQLALKNPMVAERISLLKEVYEEDFNLAATEDRDRSDFRIVPSVR
tara:strand:- start:586 stop:1266 length:681 start_codon:yes stop_codon:yes gene_type:complete